MLNTGWIAGFSMGIVRAKMKKFDLALCDLNKYYELSTKKYNAKCISYEFYYHRALCYLNRNDVSYALSDLNQSISINPKLFKNYKNVPENLKGSFFVAQNQMDDEVKTLLIKKENEKRKIYTSKNYEEELEKFNNF